MTRTAFVYTDDYVKYAYSETHPLKPVRLKLTYELIQSYRLFDLPHTCIHETVPAQRADLEAFHSADYLDVLHAADGGRALRGAAAYGLGPGDNPLFAGMYAWSRLCVGGTLQAMRLVESRQVDIAFHAAGGLHHGMPNRASGFCYVNDPVIAILELLRKGYRVAYIDIDVHHGDGVQAAFYDTDRVLTISLHENGRYLFPGTGFVHEIGDGNGTGYAVNLPLPPGVDDAVFIEGFTAVVPPLIKAYQPDIVVTQLGVDGLHDDPLAHGQLTTAAFTDVLRQIKALAPRWIATGGGGYNLSNVARAWTLAWGIMNDRELPDALPEAARLALQPYGYQGETLRDPAPAGNPIRRERARTEVRHAVDYLQAQVFPRHGIR